MVVASAEKWQPSSIVTWRLATQLFLLGPDFQLRANLLHHWHWRDRTIGLVRVEGPSTLR